MAIATWSYRRQQAHDQTSNQGQALQTSTPTTGVWRLTVELRLLMLRPSKGKERLTAGLTWLEGFCIHFADKLERMRLLQLLVILATAFTAQSQGVIRGKINDGHIRRKPDRRQRLHRRHHQRSHGRPGRQLQPRRLGPGHLQCRWAVHWIPPHVQEVVITGDDVQVVQFNLFPETFVIEQAAEVVAKVDRARDTYMENIKKKSAASIDYISSQQIKRTGDNDAASAMKRVSGVSTVGNFVFVRGLSDRYLKTTLNGAEVPSMNPRRNTIEMDLFPTNLVDNLKVVKTQTANLPSDWAGAYISVETKDFPDQFMFNYSSSLGWNTNTTGKEVLSSQRSSKDWLGYDDGSRSLNPVATAAAQNGWPSAVSVSFSEPDPIHHRPRHDWKQHRTRCPVQLRPRLLERHRSLLRCPVRPYRSGICGPMGRRSIGRFTLLPSRHSRFH